MAKEVAGYSIEHDGIEVTRASGQVERYPCGSTDSYTKRREVFDRLLNEEKGWRWHSVFLVREV